MNTPSPKHHPVACPMCGQVHQEQTASSTAIIKGERISYTLVYYVCPHADSQDNHIIPAALMDRNLMSARDAYRKAHGLLLSQEIVSLRNAYTLTQKELANLLGWGEATIARYESKFIQDKTHDEILRAIKEEPLVAKEYLEKNKASFEKDRYQEIHLAISRQIGQTSQRHLLQKALMARYAEFAGRDDITGGSDLNIPKIIDMVAFFAYNSLGALFKVKLMKLLWYSDALCYKELGHSMSGLVYQHMPMGALPICHYELISLLPHEEIYDNYEYASYKILPLGEFQITALSQEEINVLIKVLTKFNSFSGKELADYMHRETAYLKTEIYDLIPFSLSKQVAL